MGLVQFCFRGGEEVLGLGMATRCPLCRHEFTFGEVLRRWNPFANACPSCGNRLSVQYGFWVVVPVGLLLVLGWFLAPERKSYATLLIEGKMPWELLKFSAGILAAAVLLEWIFWKSGRPGYVPAGIQTGRNASVYRFVLAAGLPLLAAAAPTAILFHGLGRVEKNVVGHLEAHPNQRKDLQQKQLSPEVSRKLVLMNFEQMGKRLEIDLLICRALRIYSGFVLLLLGWLLFWSYRMVFYPPGREVPTEPKFKKADPPRGQTRRRPKSK